MTPDTPLANALLDLQQGSPGRAVYTRELVDNNSHWETVWVIYDESRRLTHLGPEPTVEFRAGAFDEGGVVVLPVLLHIGGDDTDHIYDTCINVYQIEGENIYLQDLARQERLRIHLYGERGQWQDTLTVPNSLQALAQSVLERQTTYQPSTMAAFEYARDKLYSDRGDVPGLWQALEQR
jgi:hypothetical protein